MYYLIFKVENLKTCDIYKTYVDKKKIINHLQLTCCRFNLRFNNFIKTNNNFDIMKWNVCEYDSSSWRMKYFIVRTNSVFNCGQLFIQGKGWNKRNPALRVYNKTPCVKKDCFIYNMVLDIKYSIHDMLDIKIKNIFNIKKNYYDVLIFNM